MSFHDPPRGLAVEERIGLRNSHSSVGRGEHPGKVIPCNLNESYAEHEDSNMFFVCKLLEAYGHWQSPSACVPKVYHNYVYGGRMNVAPYVRSFRTVILRGFSPIAARSASAPYQSAATSAAAPAGKSELGGARHVFRMWLAWTFKCRFFAWRAIDQVETLQMPQ